MNPSSTLRDRESAVPRPRKNSGGRPHGDSKSDEAYYTRTRELFARLKSDETGPAEREEIYRSLVTCTHRSYAASRGATATAANPKRTCAR